MTQSRLAHKRVARTWRNNERGLICNDKESCSYLVHDSGEGDVVVRDHPGGGLESREQYHISQVPRPAVSTSTSTDPTSTSTTSSTCILYISVRTKRQ